MKKKFKTEKAFGKIPAYCKYELFMERYRSASDFIKETYKNCDKFKLLDVGSGEGYLKFFCDFGNIEWHGIEIWEERYNVCKDLGYKMHRCDIDVESLPFDNELFDVVVGSHVLEHLANRKFALREMYRVLKCGGILIIAIPIKPILINSLLNFYYQIKAKTKGETCYAFDLRSLKSFLRGALDDRCTFTDVRGFRIISARKRFNWENNKSFYRFNIWFGKVFPSLTSEVNVIIKKEK